MSEAVIVLDMPKSCWECRFHVVSDLYSLEEESVCEAKCRVLKESTMKNKPKWCPLKPMPEAIPIDWLIKTQEEYSQRYGEVYKAVVINLIEDWRKENEE